MMQEPSMMIPASAPGATTTTSVAGVTSASPLTPPTPGPIDTLNSPTLAFTDYIPENTSADGSEHTLALSETLSQGQQESVLTTSNDKLFPTSNLHSQGEGREEASEGLAKKTFDIHSPYIKEEKVDGGMSEWRSASRTSSITSNGEICRICHCEAEPDKPLIQPCFCTGTLRNVHQSCIQQWIKSSDTKCCELCKFDFIMETRFKAFKMWEKLDMSPVERRKILCSVMFHIVALTCVVWSLYVLIDRTTEEIEDGNLQWPFWTKLIVVAIGFTGGLVFMYVQCKMYVQLCKRWRAYNRVIFVQNCPEEILRNQPRPDKLIAANEDAAAIAASSHTIEVQAPINSPPLVAFPAIV